MSERKRIMAVEPANTVEVMSGTFVVYGESSVEELDFYVRTCEKPEPGNEFYQEMMDKREIDLNEQYADVVDRLYRKYTRVEYRTVEPNPFF